eukprot:447020_1
MSLWFCVICIALLLMEQLARCTVITDYKLKVVWTIHISELTEYIYIPMGSESFKLNESIWSMQLYSYRSQPENNIGLFNIELCLLKMPFAWRAIQIHYSTSMSFSSVNAANDVLYYPRKNGACIIANTFSMIEELTYIKIVMSVDIIQIVRDHSTLYPQFLTSQCSNINYTIDVTNWKYFQPTTQYSKMWNFEVNATTIRQHQISNIPHTYYGSANLVVDESMWEVLLYQNDIQKMFTTNICLTYVPLYWFRMDVFCSIAYCQIGIRERIYVSFRYHDYEWCLVLSIDYDVTKLIHMMTFAKLKLQVAINIVKITDIDGDTLYRNLNTWNEYESQEISRHRELDKKCLQSTIDQESQMGISQSSIDTLQTLLISNATQNSVWHRILWPGEEVQEDVPVEINMFESSSLKIWSQVIALFIPVAFVCYIRICYIKQIIATTRKINKGCAWKKCKRNHTEFQLYICKRCKSTYYCGSNHQKKDWKHRHHRHCFWISLLNRAIK